MPGSYPPPGAWPDVSWQELVSWVLLHKETITVLQLRASDIRLVGLCPPNPVLPLRARSPSVSQYLVTLCQTVCPSCHTWLDFLAYPPDACDWLCLPVRQAGPPIILPDMAPWALSWQRDQLIRKQENPQVCAGQA